MFLKNIIITITRKSICVFSVSVLLSFVFNASGNTVTVGSGGNFTDLRSAANDAAPGDTILISGGVYSGSQYIENLKGTQDAWIVIRAAAGATVSVIGGTEGWHFSDPEYIRIERITFSGQSGNGVNVDDGGDYSTPAHDVVFDNCTWKDMDASGNNDQLKISGLDNFEIRNCTFRNGSEGGSGIDMVGCHHGVISGSAFEHQGANSIQAKGGTQHIRIEQNFFRDGGERSLNLGGSTGLEYFRPGDALFEAADLKVYSNVFIRSYAPIAFVGCIRVEVVNNTIFNPENWVVRILQETVDPARFLPCGDNVFRNNIIFLGNISTECNVGNNTAPNTFTFSNNLWFNYQNRSFTPRNLPVVDSNNLVGYNPQFKDTAANEFSITESSPAKGKGFNLIEPMYDFSGNRFASGNRSIGAFEANPVYVKKEYGKSLIASGRNSWNNSTQVCSIDGRAVTMLFSKLIFTGKKCAKGIYIIKENAATSTTDKIIIW